MKAPMTSFADRAAPLLAQGIPVFPCWEQPNGPIQTNGERKNPNGKNPRTENGFKDATTDPKQIAAWSKRWPNALVGVPTGAPSGLFVVDVDVKNGKDGFATLREKNWAVPTTRTHRTKNGGGAHYLFCNPEDLALKCSADKLGAGLDIRTDGGYIIWWPAQGCEVEHADTLADVPAWLVKAIKDLDAPRKAATPKNQRASTGDTAEGEVIYEGGRNDSLARLAGKMRRAGFDAEAIEAALQIENANKCVPPLSGDEVAGIACSIGKYEPGNAPPANADDDARISWLAQMSLLEYDRIREAEAEAMGVRVSTLDKQVKAVQGEIAAEDDPLGEVSPWAEPVDGAALLDELTNTVSTFIVCDVETARAAALWATLTWLIESVNVAPLAVITAPEKRCGKTQMLSVLGKLVRRPMSASSITPAALFRSIEAWHPTLLVDEADAFMRDNEELRGLLNSGHTRDSAYVVRVVGDDHVPARFSTWGCKAIAGIGHLADTVMDRAVVLPLRRKMAHESADRLRHAEPGLFDDLAAKLARFSQDNAEAVKSARPQLPSALNDRAQDNWEPLLAIAEVAGDHWPKLAREAALKLSGGEPDSTVGDELLSDIREILAVQPGEKISSVVLLNALCMDAEKRWATYNRGAQLTQHQLAKKLKGYGIRSKNVRTSDGVVKGFEREQFDDAFARYLSPLAPPAETATTLQSSKHAVPSVAGSVAVAVSNRYTGPDVCSGVAAVADTKKQPATLGAAPKLDCSDVADILGGGSEAYAEAMLHCDLLD